MTIVPGINTTRRTAHIFNVVPIGPKLPGELPPATAIATRILGLAMLPSVSPQ
jgi:hypothetical protein